MFQNVIDVGTKPETEIELDALFVGWSRAEIAERRLEHGVPCEVT
jgi:7-cyano-7-deazaguanine synthase